MEDVRPTQTLNKVCNLVSLSAGSLSSKLCVSISIPRKVRLGVGSCVLCMATGTPSALGFRVSSAIRRTSSPWLECGVTNKRKSFR